MPKFRITYDIVATNKAEAERHARFSDSPNAYFKVSKVRGPNSKKKYRIFYKGHSWLNWTGGYSSEKSAPVLSKASAERAIKVYMKNGHYSKSKADYVLVEAVEV